MADIDMQKAKAVYNTVKSMFDSIGWTYDEHEEDLVISSGVKGDDLPIEFIVAVKPKNQVVQLLSQMPFEVPEDKRIDLAVAVAIANYKLVDGSFDYSVTEGKIIFRLTSSYRDSVLSEEVFRYMVMVSAGTIDDYNDKFFMVSKGAMTVQQFLEAESN